MLRVVVGIHLNSDASDSFPAYYYYYSKGGNDERGRSTAAAAVVYSGIS